MIWACLVLTGTLAFQKTLKEKAKESIDHLPELIASFEQGETRARISAGFMLMLMGDAAKPAVPALVAALNDSEPFVRATAVMALHAIDPDAPTVIDAFVKLSTNEDPGRRVTAALGFRKAPIDRGIPRLLALLMDEDDEVRGTAGRSLIELGNSSQEVVTALIGALDQKQLRPFVATILGHIGPKAESAIPALTKMLADDDPNARQAAQEALERLRSK